MNSFYMTPNNGNQEMIVAFWLHMLNFSVLFSEENGCSQPRRKKNIQREYAATHLH